MDSEAITSKPVRPLPALLLTAAALCLGATLLLRWFLFGGHAGLAAIAFLGLGMIVYPAGVILLVVYALLDKPWTRPFGRAWFFWLQVLVIVAVGMSVAGWR